MTWLNKYKRYFCAEGDPSARSQPHSSKLLPSRPLGGLSVRQQKKLSVKAKQVKVASRKGDGPTSHRTDIAEAWVPLQGAGSDARMLLRLQGAHLHIGVGICPMLGSWYHQVVERTSCMKTDNRVLMQGRWAKDESCHGARWKRQRASRSRR